MKRYLFAILAAGVWMNVSEFIRNELLIKHLWVIGFKEIGLSFPSNPINGGNMGGMGIYFRFCFGLVNDKIRCSEKYRDLMGNGLRVTVDSNVEYGRYAT